MRRMRGSLRGCLGLWALWLMLQGHPSLGSALLGLLAAGVIAAWLAPDAGATPHVRLWPLIRLGGRVAIDVVRSNLTVMRLVLTRTRRLRPAWVDIRLDLPDDARVAALGVIVSLTPGTVSVDYDAATSSLRVHALDTSDPEALARQIKSRYESLLLEVFA